MLSLSLDRVKCKCAFNCKLERVGERGEHGRQLLAMPGSWKRFLTTPGLLLNMHDCTDWPERFFNLQRWEWRLTHTIAAVTHTHTLSPHICVCVSVHVPSPFENSTCYLYFKYFWMLQQSKWSTGCYTPMPIQVNSLSVSEAFGQPFTQPTSDINN